MDAVPHSVASIAEATATSASSSTVNNVKWLDFGKNMLDSQRNVYMQGIMSDVIVVAGSKKMGAHQIVLSASSDYFRSVLMGTCSPPSSHTCDGATIIIPDLNPDLLEPLMNFIYSGETFVSPTVLSEFLEACNYLKIKGFLNYACMVNGIQLQKQQQPHPHAQQPPQPLSVNSTFPATVIQPSAALQTLMTTTPLPDDNATALDMYSIHELDGDNGKYEEQEYVIGTYVADGDGGSTENVADMDATSTVGAPTATTQMESFEEYLDDDDDEANHEDPDNDDEQPLDEHTASDGAQSDEPATETPTAKEPARLRRSAPSAKKKACDSPNADATSPAAASRLSKTYSEASLAAAMAELQSGGSVIEVATRFDIPRSTIYARMRCGRDRIYRQYHQTKLDDAVRGVIETGLSLKEASTRYDVSKTVLWRALKKSKVYKPEDRIQLSRADAMLAIQRGETLISISKAYSIPLATLHRDKVRLYREGKLPDHCKLRKRDVGPTYRVRLNAAVASCRNGMPQKIASELHGVPKTTIWRHLQRSRRLEASGGGVAVVDGETDGGGDEDVEEDGEEELLEDYEVEDEVMEECEPEEQIVEDAVTFKVEEEESEEVTGE